MLGIRMKDDPSHWRQRAQETRAEAETMADPDAKQALIEISEAFERLARLAEKQDQPSTPTT
jgi:hypothetical protein